MNANSSLSVSLKDASPSELLENERKSPLEGRVRSRQSEEAPTPEQQKNWLLLTGASLTPSSFTQELVQSSHRSKKDQKEKGDHLDLDSRDIK